MIIAIIAKNEIMDKKKTTRGGLIIPTSRPNMACFLIASELSDSVYDRLFRCSLACWLHLKPAARSHGILRRGSARRKPGSGRSPHRPAWVVAAPARGATRRLPAPAGLSFPQGAPF